MPKMFPRTDFCKLATRKGNDLLLQKRQKKNGWSPTSLWREHALKNTLRVYLENRGIKATMSVSPKVLQLDL